MYILNWELVTPSTVYSCLRFRRALGAKYHEENESVTLVLTNLVPVLREYTDRLGVNKNKQHKQGFTNQCGSGASPVDTSQMQVSIPRTAGNGWLKTWNKIKAG